MSVEVDRPNVDSRVAMNNATCNAQVFAVLNEWRYVIANTAESAMERT